MLLGDLDADIGDVVKEASTFIAACYGLGGVASMTKARYKVWLRKTGRKGIQKVPELKTIPCTNEAFIEHVKRAHLQVAIWYGAIEGTTPDVEPTNFGWTEETHTRSLIPITIRKGTSSVPRELLETIRCGCSSERPCSTTRCGCFSTKLPCTVVCK